MKQLVMTATFVGVILAGALGRAESDQEAKAAFDEGSELFKNNQYKAAAGAFREAYRLRPSWKILYNIGQSHAAAKEYGEALEAFESYLAQGGDEVPQDKLNEVISQIKTLRELVGYIEIDGEEGLIVSVDGNERGQTPLPGPIAVSAGANHTLAIAKNGEKILEKPIRVGSRNTLKVAAEGSGEEKDSNATPSVSQQPARETPTTLPTDKPKKSTKPLMITGIAVGAIGLGGLGAALYTGLKAVSIQSDLDEIRCYEHMCDNEIDRMNNSQLSTNVLIGVGGTFAATGVTMLIVSLVSKKKAKQSVFVTPEIASNRGGLWISTEF